jgi:hypothetical protein
MVFGLSGNAVALDDVNGCVSASATLTGSIGSQASCADFNLAGCVVGAGGTGCSYSGVACDFSVLASVGGSEGSSFEVGDSTCQVRMAITQGNQGANYCFNYYKGGTLSDTLVTLSSKGTSVAHKQLEVCTDEEFAGGPNISLEKTVVRVERDSLEDPVYNCDDAVDTLEVIAPTEVAYCYTISNSGEGAIEELVVVDDNATPGDALDDTEIPVGTLSGGATITVDSGPVPLSVSGEFVNTAEASGLFAGGLCDTCSDSDTATVNVAVACDGDTQIIADATGTVVETNSVDGTTRCSPANVDDASVTRSVGLLCDGSCEVKEDCKGSPISCLQPCKPSHNWTYQVGSTDQCIFAEPKPGKLPLCQEVLGNPNNSFNASCSAIIHNPSVVQSNSHRTTYSSNPTLYYFPSSGGGDSTGTIYCFLHPGEDASVCPSGSFVY